MRSKSILQRGILVVSGAICSLPALAQQVTVSTPLTAVSDSFFEHTGTSWGAQGKNWFFQFGPPGNPNGAAPQFGGFNPSAGANFGFGLNGGGFLGNFSQGSRRSFTSVTPSVTVPNGGVGMIMDASISPFVMGYIPVVGGFPIVAPPPMQPMLPPVAYVPPGQASGHPAVLQALQNVPNGLASSRPHVVGAHVPEPADDNLTLNRPGDGPSAHSAAESTGRAPAVPLGSSADRPAMGLAEARSIHLAEIAQQDSEARQLLERGRYAQADGKLSLAGTYYRMVVRRASPELRQEALNLLASLPASKEDPD